MIPAIVRTGFMNLRRDRAALALSFLLPVVFFSVFALVFGQQRRQGMPKARVAIVDEDQSVFSKRLVAALEKETALNASSTMPAEKGAPAMPYDAQTAESAVRQGKVSVAVVVPRGFGETPLSFGPSQRRVALKLLHDSSDPIAPELVTGMLQKAAMISMPDLMAREGSKYLDQAAGLTPQQRSMVEKQLDELKRMVDSGEAREATAGDQGGGMIAVEKLDVLGQQKKNPTIAFYAAGIGVMFLLFTASGAGGALLEEAESGTLDRVLASQVSMWSLMAGKLVYLAVLGFLQLAVMFLWGAAVFKVELFSHLGGFFIMGVATVLATSAFGLMLAAASRTRAQLAALSTIVILIMSALGGSMFPRFIMPETMQKVGLVTFNAWALDGFTKVFWREEPLFNLWPQVGVLLGSALVFFLIARRLARRWETA